MEIIPWGLSRTRKAADERQDLEERQGMGENKWTLRQYTEENAGPETSKVGYTPRVN